MRLIFALLIFALACWGTAARTNSASSGIILRMSFRVSDQSVGHLMLLLKDYASENGYSFQDVGAIMPHKYITKPFFVNLTQDAIQIVVTDIANKNEMLLVIRGAQSNSNEPSKFAPLLNKIRGEWPDLHAYLGP